LRRHDPKKALLILLLVLYLATHLCLILRSNTEAFTERNMATEHLQNQLTTSPLSAQKGALTSPMIRGGDRTESVSVLEIPETRSVSDEELMVCLQANDSSALELFFDRYSRLVLGIAVRILRDYGEAEEVVQEAFLCLFQRAKLFDPSRGTAKAWIIQIGFHRALDRKSYLDRRGFYVNTDIGCVRDSMVANTDLEREIEAKVNWMWLEKAFNELSEMQRRTLELAFFEGMELQEICRKLNETLGNVRHHFYRGLERLRKSAFVQDLPKSER
jgi:RNA polymerase sigma-70 factor (ECF subfamily)